MERHIVTTADGSHSFFVPQLNEHYHSVHGAIQESLHIFITNGLAVAEQNHTHLNILEVGLGTGLNLFLSFLYTNRSTTFAAASQSIIYTAIEPYPISTEQAEQLNYLPLLHAESLKYEFETIHKSTWSATHVLRNNFTFLKLKLKIEEALFKSNTLHLVYFDAFSPDIQPELWTLAVFEKLYLALMPNGFLITYCAKGKVKRALKQAGFTLISLPGPEGKREITKAIKPSY